MKFFHYTTLDNGELVTSLPGYGKRTVVFSLCIDDVAVDDVLLIDGQMEATLEATAYNVMLGSNVILTTDPLATVPSSTSPEAAENNSFNITPQTHHGVADKSTSYKVTKAMPKAYVNFICWTSNSYNRPLKVEQDFGKLTVVKLRQ